MTAFFSILAAGLTLAAEQPRSGSENYTMPVAQDFDKALETVKIKKVQIITFSEILKRTSTSALFGAQNQAKRWLAQQNAETILSQSQTVECRDSSGTCNAFVTIMYWKMETIKRADAKTEVPKFIPPLVQLIEPQK